MYIRFYVISFVLIITLVSLSGNSYSQEIKLGAYGDAYIATDNDVQPTLGQTMNTDRQFAVMNNIKNQFGLNIALIGARVSYKDIVRSNIGLQVGRIVDKSMPSGSLYPYVHQANIGMRVYDKFWVDAGYFLTHIGGESLLPKDNWLTSHSLLTYFEPFYQAGVKAGYEAENMTICLHIVNGNGILEDNNKNLSFGWFASYQLSKNIKAWYSGIVGNEEPLGMKEKLHQLHNLNVELNPIEKLSIRVQADVAGKGKHKLDKIDTIEKADNFNKIKETWIPAWYWGASLIARYRLFEPFSITGRFAFVDNSEQIEGLTVNDYIKGMDITLGLEYKPSVNSYVRLEGRMLKFNEQYKVFHNCSGDPIDSRYELMLNFGTWLDW